MKPKSPAPKPQKMMSDMQRLQNLRYIVQETLWMARRYADNRSTYAPTTLNQCIELAKACGLTIEADGATGEMYARDGGLGRWIDGKFEKESHPS